MRTPQLCPPEFMQEFASEGLRYPQTAFTRVLVMFSYNDACQSAGGFSFCAGAPSLRRVQTLGWSAPWAVLRRSILSWNDANRAPFLRWTRSGGVTRGKQQYGNDGTLPLRTQCVRNRRRTAKRTDALHLLFLLQTSPPLCLVQTRKV